MSPARNLTGNAKPFLQINLKMIVKTILFRRVLSSFNHLLKSWKTYLFFLFIYLTTSANLYIFFYKVRKKNSHKGLMGLSLQKWGHRSDTVQVRM